VIHVVSGFQVAGSAHVIGCLWPSLDTVCVEVVRQFGVQQFGVLQFGISQRWAVCSKVVTFYYADKLCRRYLYITTHIDNLASYLMSITLSPCFHYNMAIGTSEPTAERPGLS